MKSPSHQQCVRGKPPFERIGSPNDPDPKKYFDLAMLVLPGGRERDEPEWRALFTAAGFRLERIIPTPAPHSILEGTPL